MSDSRSEAPIERVWVLMPIGYDEDGIVGVFATPEAAKGFYDHLKWEDEDKDGICHTVGADALERGHYCVVAEEVRG